LKIVRGWNESRELSKILPILETDVKSLGIETKVLC
jgi:hypothetical protein